MNILIIDRSPPCNLLQGNALIGQHLFRRLRHHHLTLICPAPSAEIPRYQAELAQGFDAVHLVPRELPVSALVGMFEPAMAQVGVPRTGSAEPAAARALGQKVQQVLRQQSFDVIHTRQLPMAAITAGLKHPAKLIELIDSETLQAARRVRPGQPKTKLRALLARTLEQRALRQFHACTTVAEPDAQVLRELVPGLPVHVTPNGVDADFFHPLDLPEQPETVVFTGAMSFPPNVTAVLHYYHNILPLVRATLPNVRLIIAGRDPAPAVAALADDPTVKVTGFVEDIRPYLAGAGVMICPMTSGSGIKNKVLEAMAMARPVLATTLGMEALEVTNWRELVVADEPVDFAAALVRLLGDATLRRQIGAAGRELVMRRYTWDACAVSYDAIYSQLAARRTYAPPTPLYTPGRHAERPE